MAPRHNEAIVFEEPRNYAAVPVGSPASHRTMLVLSKDVYMLHSQTPSPPPLPSMTPDSRSCEEDQRHHSWTTAMNETDRRDHMTTSLHSVRDRADQVLRLLECCVPDAVSEACQTAIRTKLSFMLNQANLILEGPGNDPESAAAEEIRRLPYLLFRCVQYLDIIEAALTNNPNLERQQAKLKAISESVAAYQNLDANLDEQARKEASGVWVSDWEALNLAFDVRVGAPSRKSAEEDSSLPLMVEVEPVVELEEGDLNRDVPCPAAQAFSVSVQKCTHNKHEYAGNDGTVGDAMVKIHIAPVQKREPKKEFVWKPNQGDVDKVRIKEVRAIQRNAYPHQPRINCDLYTSSEFGDSGVTMYLSLHTCPTLTGETPDLHIQLVVEPTTN